MDVDNTITCDLYVVSGDTCLWEDLDNLLSEVMDVCDFVDEWNLPRETRVELPIELLKSMEHAGVLLANNDTEAKVENTSRCSSGAKCID